MVSVGVVVVLRFLQHIPPLLDDSVERILGIQGVPILSGRVLGRSVAASLALAQILDSPHRQSPVSFSGHDVADVVMALFVGEQVIALLSRLNPGPLFFHGCLCVKIGARNIQAHRGAESSRFLASRGARSGVYGAIRRSFLLRSPACTKTAPRGGIELRFVVRGALK